MQSLIDKQLLDPFEGILLLRKFVYHFAAAPKKLTSKTVAQHIVNKEVLDFFEVSHISQISNFLLLFTVPCLICRKSHTFYYHSIFLSFHIYDNHNLIYFMTTPQSLAMMLCCLFVLSGADDLSFLTRTRKAGIHGKVHTPLRYT